MAELMGKRFENPDEVRQFTDGKGRVELVDLNGHAVGLGTFEPGWRWSENVKPIVGTDSCHVDHIGYVLEGDVCVVHHDIALGWDRFVGDEGPNGLAAAVERFAGFVRRTDWRPFAVPGRGSPGPG
ncbi:MAG: hypothetical protein JO321_07960 [Solirubrobacterales bacterium]|nr:hypothetical protein [Solirubrobacterales bacterium]MBV9164878.1 hypothetical protein [Solirubrobacterales bacterium]MBV9535327.1 hypothetical protein [Solirubrobacterales bacterium]